MVLVKMKIVELGKFDIKIDFKVCEDWDGDWCVYDMIVEGISLFDVK